MSIRSCNHCGVMTAFKSQELERFKAIFVFLEKRHLMVKFSKILFRKFSPPRRSTLLCWNVVIFFRREIGEIVRYLPAKKFGCLSNCRYCTDRAQTLPGPASSIWLTMFQISPESVHFDAVIAKRTKAAFFAHRVLPWFASNTFEANNNMQMKI